MLPRGLTCRTMSSERNAAVPVFSMASPNEIMHAIITIRRQSTDSYASCGDMHRVRTRATPPAIKASTSGRTPLTPATIDARKMAAAQGALRRRG